MSRTHDWLNLIEVSGPFLAEQVLNKTLPDGLDTLQQGVAPRLRSAYNEWRDAVDAHDKDINELHTAWLDEVLFNVLDYDDRCLKRDSELPARLKVTLPEHGVDLSPDMILVNPSKPEEPLLLISTHDPDLDLNKTLKIDGLASTPSERMVTLLRSTGNVLGLVTNGEAWMLVHAPSGAVASYTTWYARMFGQARDTLRAFASLLGIHRFTGPSVDTLPSLFDLSLEHQGDVTEALGDQVAKAIEVLMRALDRADQDRSRDLLRDVTPSTLYEAGLTLMMRLVFILSAEERGLLLLGDPIYDSHYAISSLRSQLAGTDPAILERRNSAWSRMLATFRLVHDGVDHPDMRFPALGGSLFDPDRFPFLEGRKIGSDWHQDPADPLPIDDRTVLLLLEAIQVLKGRNLSYRALDVEQIGHVYEGLLDQTINRVKGITLQLKGAVKTGAPLVMLDALETAQNKSSDDLLALLEERTERSLSALQNDVNTPPDKEIAARLLTGCRGDATLRDRIQPFAKLLANDPWGLPLVHHAGAIVIVHGTDRRESGAHYTPKSLTEKIVKETLDPVVYRGPAEGVPRAEWQLKTPAKILDLKICDPAMGSGAFLVQVCRWLAKRLLESWSSEEDKGRHIDVEGHVLDDANNVSEPLPCDPEERATLARRMIAEKCLYGVDMNPLAVELAKLSLWLTTLAKGRPFGFLEHNLKSGDSLLGISNLEQLIELDMKPKQSGQLRLFGRSIRKSVEEATELRSRLREIPLRDITDVEAMAQLDGQSRRILDLPKLVGDAFVGGILANKKATDRNARIETIAALSDDAAIENGNAAVSLERMASEDLAVDASNGRPRRPFHWPLEFPEVFRRENSGFDAIVGNPPFLGGTRISELSGDAYNDYLSGRNRTGKKVDLCAYFFRSSDEIVRHAGAFGLIATNTISQGTTRKGGLDPLAERGSEIIFAHSAYKWPGSAAVVTSNLVVFKGRWRGVRSLNSKVVNSISTLLLPSSNQETNPHRLAENTNVCFTGSSVLGKGFVINQFKAKEMLQDDASNIAVVRPYIGGKELNNRLNEHVDGKIIDFFERDFQEASKFKTPLRHLEQHVKPDRLKKDPKKYPRLVNTWWKFWHSRQKLYLGIKERDLQHVLARARISDHHMIDFLPADIVFSEQLVVFLSEQWSEFGILQSSVHDYWSRKYASTMKNDVRYMPTDCFETFPLPTPKALQGISGEAQSYYQIRNSIREQEGIGLTKIYNALHNPHASEKKIDEMRSAQIQLDKSVLNSYGWSDLTLDHDFRSVQVGSVERIRFKISPKTMEEILSRLASLNAKRYQIEVDQGLHGDVKNTAKKQPAPGTVKQTLALSLTLDLEPHAPVEKVETPKVEKPEPPIERLYNWLYNQNGKWVPKNKVASATGISPEELDKAVSTLVADDDLHVRGEGEETLLKVKG